MQGQCTQTIQMDPVDLSLMRPVSSPSVETTHGLIDFWCSIDVSGAVMTNDSAVSRSAIYPTRLETRTKESSIYAS